MGIRPLLAAIEVIGFLLTSVNVVLGYRKTKRRLARAGHDVATSDKYAEEEAAAQRGSADSEPTASAGQQTTTLTPTPLERHIHELSAHDLLDALKQALRAGRNNLLYSGLGLVLTTAASIWSLFV